MFEQVARPRRFKQIAGYVSCDERIEFARFAEQHGLAASNLLNMLVRRELRGQRLATLAITYRSCLPLRQCVKVIAHLNTPDLNEQFAEHAEAHGLSVAAAAGVLVRTELTERWLAAAMLMDGAG